jgi:hypothetical protein
MVMIFASSLASAAAFGMCQSAHHAISRRSAVSGWGDRCPERSQAPIATEIMLLATFRAHPSSSRASRRWPRQAHSCLLPIPFPGSYPGKGMGRQTSAKYLILLVPGEGFEPPTNGLQNRCSTAELTRRNPKVSMH